MLSKIAIKRPITTIMVTLMVFICGVLSYTNLELALMPSVDLPMAMVMTSYSQAGPEEIENLITEPVEEAFASVSGVDTVSSSSRSGMSMVFVEFVDGTDMDFAKLDLQEALDKISNRLPDDASDPTIMSIDMDAVSFEIGVTSTRYDLEALHTLVDEDLVSEFERIDGISAVTASGGTESEITITVDPYLLASYGLTTNTLAQSLSSENTNLPSGSMMKGQTSVQINTYGEFETIEDIRGLPISTPTGAIIELDEIADIYYGEKDRTSLTYIEGQDGILISLDKESTANTVTVSDGIQETMQELQEEYPDLTFYTLSDSADYIKLAIDSVTNTALIAGAIAFFVLLLFLRNGVTAGIIAASIPTSIFATYGMMYLAGLSLNSISLGGLTIGIGMLVDNSVVVLDNIYQHYERGLDPQEAAEVGTKEVSLSIMASTLTTIAVFLPIAMTGGTVGEMMANLSYTVTFALAASFVVSLTFVPMAATLLLQKDRMKRNRKETAFTKILSSWDKALNALSSGYEKAIRWSLKNPKKLIALVLAIFLGSLATVPLTGVNFMETTDESTVSLSISLPEGSELDETDAVILKVLERLEVFPEIEQIYASVGGGMMSDGTNRGTINMDLVSISERDKSTEEVAAEMQTLMNDIAGANISVRAARNAMGSMGGTDISFNIYGYDNDILLEIEEDIVAILEEVEGLDDVEGSSGDTSPEANVTIDRSKAAQYGVTTSSVASALSTALSGTTATQFTVDGTEIDVVIQYDEDSIEYVSDLSKLTVTTNTGALIPITDVADIEYTESSRSISREDGKNFLSISATADGIDNSTSQAMVDAALENYIFPDNCSYGWSGTTEMMQDSMNSMYTAFIVAVLLVYMIMASQFESLRYPFIIMLTMPLSVTGGILGLFLTGKTITMPAMMGFVMLVGMVVNNGIVLIDYANQLVAKGMTAYEALLIAGPRRLRPILMTTLTTIFCMIPVAVSTAEGSEMLQAMAVAVIFGLTLSTALTLLFIPVSYMWLNNVKEKNDAKRAARKAKRDARSEENRIKLEQQEAAKK